MIISVTAARDVGTFDVCVEKMKTSFIQLRKTMKDVEWVNFGGCIGGDHAARSAAEQELRTVKKRLILPADRSQVHDVENWEWDDVVELPRGSTYMDRNDLLVMYANVLVAFPRTPHYQVRSGTWSTIRRGWKAKLPVMMWPLEL